MQIPCLFCSIFQFSELEALLTSAKGLGVVENRLARKNTELVLLT